MEVKESEAEWRVDRNPISILSDRRRNTTCTEINSTNISYMTYDQFSKKKVVQFS